MKRAKRRCRYVYVHIFADKDRESFAVLERRLKGPVQGNSHLSIFKDRKQVFRKDGEPRNMNSLLLYKVRELNGEIAALTEEFKAELKEADDLTDGGKFLSACDKIMALPDGMIPSDQCGKLLKETVKRIEEAALEKIEESKRLVEAGDTEGKRLDGAYQLMLIRLAMPLESIRTKTHEVITALKENPKNGEVFTQGSRLADARHRLRTEDVSAAKLTYENVIRYHPGTEAEKRAKERLAELEGKK